MSAEPYALKRTMMELRSQGYTLQEVGDTFGLTGKRVQQVCRRPDLWKPLRSGRPRRFSKAAAQTLYTRYLTGATLSDLAAAEGCSAQTIAAAFGRIGKPRRKVRRPRKEAP